MNEFHNKANLYSKIVSYISFKGTSGGQVLYVWLKVQILYRDVTGIDRYSIAIQIYQWKVYLTFQIIQNLPKYLKI